jgi:septal ring factor EnvC (AmiA/AmiB activator)
MLPMNDHTTRQRARPALKPATSLVECAVRVSPTLARLIRKSAAAEAEGASAVDALLTPIGSRAGEVEQLRDQIKQLTDELGVAHVSVKRLRQDMDASKADLARCFQDRAELERRLKVANALDEKRREKIADAEARLADLEKAVTRQEAALHQSISVDGLDESAAFTIRTLKDRLSRGDEVRAAALIAGGYDPRQVEAAMADRDRDEMRAFERLLTSPTWRRRVVLWLLGTKRTHQ